MRHIDNVMSYTQEGESCATLIVYCHTRGGIMCNEMSYSQEGEACATIHITIWNVATIHHCPHRQQFGTYN